MATTTQIRGTVVSVNERGVKLEGESEWRNFSQYAKDLPSVAPRDVVDVQIDGRSFIRSIVIIDAPQASSNGHTAPCEYLPTKDLQIIRESCIKSAAAFCAARSE